MSTPFGSHPAAMESRKVTSLRKAASARASGKDRNSEGETSVFSGRKQEALVLGALTCMVTASIATSVGLAGNLQEPDFLLRIARRVLIPAQLLTATRVLWKAASRAMSTEDRFAPGRPVALAALLLSWALCGLLAYVAVHLWGSDPASFRSYPINVLEFRHSAVLAHALIGVIVVTGFLSRKRMKPLVRDRTDNSDLSTVL